MSAHRYWNLCLVGLCCLAAMLAAPAAAGAHAPLSSTPDEQVWITNGAVDATAIGPDGTTYIGGNFTYVGPVTGCGAALDATSGARDTAFPLVNGHVYAAVPDGAGGFYIGGVLHQGGRPHAAPHRPHPGRRLRGSCLPRQRQRRRRRPRRLGLDGLRGRGLHHHRRPDPQPHRRSGCEQRLRHGLGPRRWRSLPYGLRPRRLGLDRLRRRLVHHHRRPDAQLHRRPRREQRRRHGLEPRGRPTGRTPSPSRARSSMPAARSPPSAARPATASPPSMRAAACATAWNPEANSTVIALAVSGSTVYAGGTFSTIGGQSRGRIAALDAGSGLATAWDPEANGYVMALAVSGSTVYVGGRLHAHRRRGPQLCSPPSTRAAAWPRPGTRSRE